jgi:hypothetical protein
MLGLILLLVFKVCLSNAGKWLFRSILKRVGNYYLIGERSEGSAYFIGSIHIKMSMTRQEKGDLSIQVTA